MRHFTPQQLQKYLTTGASPLLLDVREPWEFDICHIENSVLVPMGQIPTRLDMLDKARETIVICHHGIRSRQVAMYLEHYAFENVINLTGGVEAWAEQVDSSMPRY